MLYYDHYYTIGKTHVICEDFALQADKPIPFIVLSDGCSSSYQTHIGARILTLTTKYIIENTENWPLNYTQFGQQLIDNAWNVARKMRLSSSVLDATVMLAFLYQNSILVYVYGDGCLLFKDHQNNLGSIEIVFTHNAPYLKKTFSQKSWPLPEAQFLIWSSCIGIGLPWKSRLRSQRGFAWSS